MSFEKGRARSQDEPSERIRDTKWPQLNCWPPSITSHTELHWKSGFSFSYWISSDNYGQLSTSTDWVRNPRSYSNMSNPQAKGRRLNNAASTLIKPFVSPLQILSSHLPTLSKPKMFPIHPIQDQHLLPDPPTNPYTTSVLQDKYILGKPRLQVQIL